MSIMKREGVLRGNGGSRSWKEHVWLTALTCAHLVRGVG